MYKMFLIEYKNLKMEADNLHQCLKKNLNIDLLVLLHKIYLNKIDNFYKNLNLNISHRGDNRKKILEKYPAPNIDSVDTFLSYEVLKQNSAKNAKMK